MRRPGSWSVATYDDSIVLPYDRLDVMSFDIMNGAIVVVPCLDRYISVPESATASVCLLGELGGVPILLIKLNLGLLI